MNERKPFAALAAEPFFTFSRNSFPHCPHCGHECDPSDNEWWFLYASDEEVHEVTCPKCEQDFQVETHVSYSFSTDEQDGFDLSAAMKADLAKPQSEATGNE